jgi:UDP-N-acetylmuramate--alanine ligase
VQTALAAIAIATEIGVTDEVISQALSLFQGVGRRFQMRGEVSFGKGNALLIDDYGHHPREITSTIDAIRNVWPQKRLVHVFQPHRYSRTEALFDEFSESLVKSDEIVLLDIYSAGEEPVDGICSQSLADKMRKLAKDKSIAVTPISGVDGVLSKLVQEGDILLMQGAGSIGTLAKDLSESHQVQVD